MKIAWVFFVVALTLPAKAEHPRLVWDASIGIFDPLFQDLPICHKAVGTMAPLEPGSKEYQQAARLCLDAFYKWRDKIDQELTAGDYGLGNEIARPDSRAAIMLARELKEQRKTLIDTQVRLFEADREWDEKISEKTPCGRVRQDQP